jgi:hypothetical protein
MRLDSNFCFSTSFIAEKTSKRSTVEQSIGIFFQWLCFLLDLFLMDLFLHFFEDMLLWVKKEDGAMLQLCLKPCRVVLMLFEYGL